MARHGLVTHRYDLGMRDENFVIAEGVGTGVAHVQTRGESRRPDRSKGSSHRIGKSSTAAPCAAPCFGCA